MAKLATQRKASASLALGSIQTSVERPFLKLKQLEKVILTLYRAIVHRQGLYKFVTMETHAPQILYYPGSTASQRVKLVPSSLQVDFFSHHQEPEENQLPTLVAPFTLLHRRWLWFTTLTDRREISERVYSAHCKIYEDHPEFYNKDVIYMDVKKFRGMLRNGRYKVGSPNQSAGNWLICAFTLYTRFDGDPVKLLKHAGWSVEKVYAWKHKEKKRLGYDPIPGWGRKLISLYFLYLSGLGETLPDDAFASDVHAQAIPLQTNSVSFGDAKVIYTSPFAEMLRKAITKICREKGYEVLLVAHASWLLGSQGCTKCSKWKEAELLCPIYKECGGRVDTGSYFAKGLWRKDGQIMNKGGARPKFGLPTDFLPREHTGREAKVIPIRSLFEK